MARFVIEGEWTGYTSRQARVVHVSVTSNVELAAWVKENRAIAYSDGTSLLLSVRECKSGERVKENPSYRELIDECFQYKCRSVLGLCDLKAAKQSAPLRATHCSTCGKDFATDEAYLSASCVNNNSHCE
jgi:hypothetical protein